jgi:hypothetical protein
LGDGQRTDLVSFYRGGILAGDAPTEALATAGAAYGAADCISLGFDATKPGLRAFRRRFPRIATNVPTEYAKEGRRMIAPITPKQSPSHPGMAPNASTTMKWNCAASVDGKDELCVDS